MRSRQQMELCIAPPFPQRGLTCHILNLCRTLGRAGKPTNAPASFKNHKFQWPKAQGFMEDNVGCNAAASACGKPGNTSVDQRAGFRLGQKRPRTP